MGETPDLNPEANPNRAHDLLRSEGLNLPARDPLPGRPACAAGLPARPQVSRCIGLSGSDRNFPALTGRSGTQRARPLRPELAALLGFWLSSQLAECAAGRRCWRLCGDVAVLPCCTVYRISSSGRSRPDRFRLDRRVRPVLRERRRMALNCNPNCSPQIRAGVRCLGSSRAR